MSACLLASYNSSCIAQTSKTLPIKHCIGIFWLSTLRLTTAHLFFLTSSCCIEHQISSYLAPDQCQLDSDRWWLARHCGESPCSYPVISRIVKVFLWIIFISNLLGVLSPTVNIFYFLLFCSPLVDYIILPSCSRVFLHLQSVNVVFRGFEVEQNFVTSQSSPATSTSVSGLLPSTVYMVTVTGMYNESRRPSVYRTVGIKTDMEKGAGPRKLVQCVQMHTHT